MVTPPVAVIYRPQTIPDQVADLFENYISALKICIFLVNLKSLRIVCKGCLSKQKDFK